ncbi:MAG: hypothetical protein L0Y50_12570 [Beijerinckiaceae bacterium]|nr:hypothetical protein [Beijerinckiaceae bacterium]
MGAVEHLKNVCCLGLPPESVMIAVTPLPHESFSRGCGVDVSAGEDGLALPATAERLPGHAGAP